VEHPSYPVQSDPTQQRAMLDQNQYQAALAFHQSFQAQGNPQYANMMPMQNMQNVQYPGHLGAPYQQQMIRSKCDFKKKTLKISVWRKRFGF
jgi:hypothetical protein